MNPDPIAWLRELDQGWDKKNGEPFSETLSRRICKGAGCETCAAVDQLTAAIRAEMERQS